MSIADKDARCILPREFIKTSEKPDLLAGLYIVLGGSGRGKSLGSVAMCMSATAATRFMYINESHGTVLDLSWLLRWLKPQHGFFGLVTSAIENGLGDGDTSVSSAPVPIPTDEDEHEHSLFLFDSATLWCWQAETIMLVSTATKGPRLEYRSSAAKSGGLTGSLSAFLLAVDQAAYKKKKTVIFTVNTTQYPVGSQARDKEQQWQEVYDLFKGMATGICQPDMQPGGISRMRISDRSDRKERDFVLEQKHIESAAKVLRQKLSDSGSGEPDARSLISLGRF